MASTAKSPVSPPVLRGATAKTATAPKQLPLSEQRRAWRDAFAAVRAETQARAALLSAEDQIVQSMPDASPVKWHRAHVTWFFEQFLVQPNDPSYRVFDERFPFLFNSYYVAAGPRHARPQRGLITRPNSEEVSAYRAHIEAAVERLIETIPEDRAQEFFRLLEIGLHHEQQHQELLITDILHAFAQNPTHPAYDEGWRMPRRALAQGGYADLPAGIHKIGHDGEGYCFDNELSRHDVLIQPVRLARQLVSNGEWLEFIADGGYEKPALWLSDGWAAVQAEGWQAPGYWLKRGEAWQAMTLRGLVPVDPAALVCHVSYYEAEAFARWAGKHLPTEMEWEVAARAGLLSDAYGFVWQWTRSAYLPYPGYRVEEGALGEYNGKFMVNQMVLRGSSLATPAGHERVSYRNFFTPPSRWQFTGLRLADHP